jgi:hypothetical protein
MSGVGARCSRRAVKVAIYKDALRHAFWGLSRLWLRNSHLDFDVCKRYK